MVVVPGTFFIDLALGFHRDNVDPLASCIQRAAFHSPVILSDKNVILSMEIKELDDHTVQYDFRETGEARTSDLSGPVCARVVIESDGGHHAGPNETNFSAKAFQQKAALFNDEAGFYRRLRENGNQYGPRFQNLRQVWRADEECLGRLRVTRNSAPLQNGHLDPILMDGAVQLLSTFFLDQGRTFIFKGASDIALVDLNFPTEVWVHARLRSQGDLNAGADVAEYMADLEVFDDAGFTHLKLQGVRFAYLDQPATSATSETLLAANKAKIKVVVASTFTAEPVEESLKFWSDYLAVPVQTSFAPYNQVFQELLNPASEMRQNQDGVNLLLINLADWAKSGVADLPVDSVKIARFLGHVEQHTLPNGLRIAHLNRHETEYVYQEIFEDGCYLRHGIQLPADATVIDIGANIGLFSLFVRTRSPRANVYAFEPSPVAFRALKANCEAYGPNLQPFNVGVSERRGSATLTFYDKSSVFSSFHPSAEEDRQAVQAVVANMVQDALGKGTESSDQFVAEFMTDRMTQQTFECPLVSVADIIRENGLRRVDLLKVDAEKCELEILRGIDEGNWAIIDQVVIEVHDKTRRLVTEVQDLLARRGFQCAVEEENLLTGSGLFNVYATRPKNGAVSQHSSGNLQPKVDQFIQALDSSLRASRAPMILCLCPPGQNKSPGAISAQELAACENRLATAVQQFPNITVIRSEAIRKLCQNAEIHDPHANEAGHVPYTPEGFAAIGTGLFRNIAGLRRQPYKVLVLDCDNTLWQGVCAEEGPRGVQVNAPHRALHEFVIRQMTAGMLVCLCSKNAEEDVWAVFAEQPAMELKVEHLAAWRINWAPKSENLKSLARELNLGLDSFILLDDNPVECAEVRANCPEVMTLQLPTDIDRLPQFLDNAWAFDHSRITDEDRTRTRKVLENVQREKYRGQVSTLKDFIDGLQLQVNLFAPGADHYGRVAQLTQRTNQFNFTTVRRSEPALVNFLGPEKGRALVAKVSDRFGDYGLVGLLLYREDATAYDVDTFLLSCRVLGRGVEHQILSTLGRQAVDQGKSWVNLTFRPTDKNLPAWKFIQSVGAQFMTTADGVTTLRFPATTLAALRYDPDASLDPVASLENESPRSSRPSGLAGQSEKFQRIGEELNTAQTICAAIEAHRSQIAGTTLAVDDLPPTLAGRILGLWRQLIGNPRIGMDDNFVDVGGTSLKAVQIIAAIRRELDLHLSIVNIFECPTVRLLAEKLSPAPAVVGAVNEAMERGARRKQRLRRPADQPPSPAA